MPYRNTSARHALLGIAAALACVVALPSPAWSQAEHVRWDIVRVVPPSVFAGGTDVARAQDGSTIAMTGSGTFVAPSQNNNGSAGSNGSTTGGGTWTTFNAAGTQTGSGTYEVDGLVRWERRLGTSPAPLVPNDTIDEGVASSGLAALRLLYSDGSRGILVVNCNLPPTDPQEFEGITATKGLVDYWTHVSGATLFHVKE
jgi:hypothetical protein